MNQSYNVTLMSSLVLLFALGTAGCGQEGPAERAGRSVDQTAERAGQSLDRTADRAEQSLDRTAENTGDRMEEIKEATSAKAEEARHYVDDAAITAKVKADFLADPVLKVFQIHVTTTGGVVTLSGEVDSQASIDRSEAIARGVDNVVSVQNELVLKPSA